MSTEASIRLTSVAASDNRCFAGLNWTGVHPTINHGHLRPQLLAAVAAAGRHLESGVLVPVDPGAHRITLLPIDRD